MRVEILGQERRRRWREEEKLEIVMSVGASGATITEVAHMHTLSRMENGLDRMREDFREEKENARESRAVIHERLDEQGRQIAKTEETIAISGLVDAQIRDEVKALQKTVATNHEESEPAACRMAAAIG